ncbi:MAG: nickel pincer cofactor biosynthesis protein LarB [Armatimonadetes bacterium]|nr:nickel pincer cofactor biosynthesis protein LarB [Armatimonadota bacterium]
MDAELIRNLLEDVRSGRLSVDGALGELRTLPYEDIEFAKLDMHRGIRTGFPEVVFCQGKTCEQSVEIVKRLAERNTKVLATRVTAEVADRIVSEVDGSTYHELARMVVIDRGEKKESGHPADSKYIMVVCAGTADIPVAEEAAVTAEALGSRVERSYDVGVAGIHRLLDQKKRLMDANVLIVVAGMEGALASVVGGMVSRPVVAVPTSVGYGASFGGLAALLAMLNSCASGVAVMNIDNGFGAGYFAHLINK